ncbi:MAG TPA: sulfatase-like hydrolase/transferase [Chloroflexota bacterium]|nr:sulfatase-like hydrolase/transferase [Chloroflexota bacterium]
MTSAPDTAVNGKPEPTNLLFICSDQHSRHVLGCYGNPVVRTPNLDALAARGTRLENAYTNTPICVPARSCLATGRYAHTIGSWDNATPYVGTEAPSWGHRLTQQGHRVTTVGKLHYRAPEDPTGYPDQRLPMHVLAGGGEAYGLLRDRMPPLSQTRQQVLSAGAGESEYTRYDRAVADAAVSWLRDEMPSQADTSGKPWALFVSFVYPHFPLVVPEAYLRPYPLENLPLPVQWHPDEWPHHPVLDWKRQVQHLDEPIDEPAIRRALQTYCGMVTFLDEQIGRVLAALQESGRAGETRVIYTSDHGDMMGEHGLWFKSVMYDGAAGVPLILAGPGVPAGKTVCTNVSLVDCFPTVLEIVGVLPTPEDAALPGRSLLQLVREGDRPRTVFSEYHAIYSPSGTFMVRTERHKYVHYVGPPSQLFDMIDDPDEPCDLAADPAHASTLAACRQHLYAICDPEQVDRRARADQQRRIEAAGGVQGLISRGPKIAYTPSPKL